MVLAFTGMMVLYGCAFETARLSTPEQAIAAACRRLHNPANCHFDRARLNGDTWEVDDDSPPPTNQVGGGATVYVSARTGRVLKIIVGQ
jgi:hypothetical protein